MEMLERNGHCIDELTLLVSAMKMTIHKKQSPYKPKIYQGRSRNQIETDRTLHLETDLLVETEVKVEIGKIIIIETITDQTTETETVEIELEITTMAIWEVEVGIEIMTNQFSQDKVHYLMGETNLGPDPTLG